MQALKSQHGRPSRCAHDASERQSGWGPPRHGVMLAMTARQATRCCSRVWGHAGVHVAGPACAVAALPLGSTASPVIDLALLGIGEHLVCCMDSPSDGRHEHHQICHCCGASLPQGPRQAAGSRYQAAALGFHAPWLMSESLCVLCHTTAAAAAPGSCEPHKQAWRHPTAHRG